ncbi:ABC transporter permease [Planomicrobium sp. CPCC 101079]|uniref:ABC transporter permease n=1 Tax=Planomicrobium sp. CPCC 101079 TaxID=2599618 RepID=UPI0011B795D9|nr:ABC transporter permease [Planomicrobium sp. CPCC 101079]TWT01596.1 ABC transporter permease [Planomicrobium sp. CPCC 101079]
MKDYLMYLIKRILSLIPVLFVVSIIVFLIIHITPGDPATIMLGEDATTEQIEELREDLGLNLPLPQQYLNWVIGALQVDLGSSYFMDESVTSSIMGHLSPTISLTIISQLVALVIAIPAGIFAARRRGTIADQSVMGVSLLGMSVPNFILGLLTMLVFGVILRWLPVAGYAPLNTGLWNHLQYLILPAVSLGTLQAALITRITRSSMLEVLNNNYIKSARAKGVKERQIIYFHVFRNAFLPILTVIGQTFGGLIAGAVITETIFNIPGIGQLTINSIERRDYPMIQGIIFFVAIAYVLINLIVDLLYGVVNPRVRLDRK